MRRLLFVAALLLVPLTAAFAMVEVAEVVEPADAGPEIDVGITEFGPVHVAYMEQTGSYANAPKAFSTLLKELKKQKIQPSGALIGICYDNPEEVPENELRWEVAVEVAEGTKAKPPLMVKVIEPRPVATTHFRGSPDGLTQVYQQLAGAAADMGHPPVGPGIEVYNAMPSSRIIDCTVMFVLGAGGPEGMGMPTELVIPEPAMLVFTEHTGSYDQIGPATEAFFGELEAQGVEPVGPLMHVFLNDPAETPEEELRWQVAVPVEHEYELAEPLRMRWVPERIVARTAYVGPPEGAGEVFHGLAEYATRRGYVPVGPAVMMYPPHPEQPEMPEPEVMIDDAVEGTQPPEPMGEHPPMEMVLTFRVEKMPPVESEIVIIGPQLHVVMGHTGPFEGLNEATEAFYGELEAQGIHPAGPCTRLFHTEPGEEAYAELCVPIDEEREVGEPLELRVVPECAVARCHYEGPMAGVPMAHRIMTEQMAERGWRQVGPFMQTIHDRGEGHVACTLRFVVAKMEGEPGEQPEEPGMTDEGHIPIKVLGPVKVIQPGKVKIQDPDAGQ